MKFSCTQENLSSGLALVAHIAARTSTLPILSNILLRTSDRGLELVATNLEVAVVTAVRGKVEEPGEVTVQGKLMAESVGLLPSDRVDISTEGNELTVRCGRQRAALRTLPTDDYPVIPEVGTGVNLTPPTHEFAQGLAQVGFAVAVDDGRPELSGIYLCVQGFELVLAGTDSYRLAERRLVMTAKPAMSPNPCIIPLRAVQEFVRVLQASGEETCSLTIGENQILVRAGDTTVTSRLVAGSYPDYQSIIPQRSGTGAVVERGAFIQAVRAASLFVRSGINDVRLELDPETKTLAVNSTNSQLGESSNDVTCASATGVPVQTVFNFRYLLDGLQAMGASEVELEFTDQKSPVVFRPHGKQSSGSYLYIIMPIRQ